MHRERLYEKLCHISPISDGAIPGVPLIEIIADKRVLIENHHGVYCYTRDHICIHTSSGMIRVDGEKLYLEKMTQDQLTIVGKINGVLICNGGKNAD